MNTQICSGPCALEKSIDLFYLRSNGKPRNECKECSLIRNKIDGANRIRHNFK